MVKKLLLTPIRPKSPETASSPRDAPFPAQRRNSSADPPTSFHAVRSTVSDWDSKIQTSHGKSLFQTIIVERHEADLPQRLSRRCAIFVCVLIAVGGLWGCEKVNSVFHRSSLPNLGPRLANSVKLTFDPSFTNLKMQYIDGCNSPHELYVGEEVESLMIHAASQNFAAVTVIGGVPAQFQPDTEIVVTLQRSGLKLWADNVYDRVPADLTIETLVTLKDATGKELGRQTISIVHNQRLILEPAIRRCEYGNIEEFVHDAGIEFSTQFMRAVRAQLAATGGTAPASVATSPVKPVPAAAAISVPGTSSALSFKATVLDENSNLVLEGGERIRVRIDLMNGGEQDLQSVTAALTGTASLLAQFPITTLAVGRLQPGQSRSVEFSATVPQSMQQQKAEIHVAVSDVETRAQPPSQTLALLIQPTGIKTDDVDQIQTVVTGFQQPNTYLISIGIGSYRNRQVPSRKFASLDAQIVSNYFQALGGLPTSNILLLQDWKAIHSDIDEALLDWLPPHMNKDAVVIVYFAGLATVSSTGETFLVPYDGTATTTSRAYPIQDLEAALSRLNAKQTVFLFDGVVSRMGPENRAKTALPQWNPTGSSTIHIIGTSGIGQGLEDHQHRHGLFTYYLLRALRGDADTNRDGNVTLGETVSYLSQKVRWASKTYMNQEQRPFTVPAISPTDPSAALILTKVAAIQGAEGH
jgi:caspase domain-containing protein